MIYSAEQDNLTATVAKAADHATAAMVLAFIRQDFTKACSIAAIAKKVKVPARGTRC